MNLESEWHLCIGVVFATIVGYLASVGAGTEPNTPVRVRDRHATRTGQLAPGRLPDRT
jgi:hypothetical protein